MNVPLYAVSNYRSRGHDGGSGHGGFGLGHAAEAGDEASGDGRRYARTDGSPVWEAFESIVGSLEGGWATSFSSGMAAVASVLELVPVGGRILLGRDRYMGTQHVLEDGEETGRWHVTVVDLLDPAAVAAELDGAAMLWIETPSNPLLEVCDLAALSAAARAADVMMVVDNTFATPLRQRPLQWGADVVVHSATKFMGGHSDLMMGVAIVADRALHGRLVRRRAHAGAIPGALESFLALRGLRTMAVRLDAAERSAGELARRLARHPAIEAVRYPGLADAPGHALARAQMSGFGSVLSFQLPDAPTADAVCEAVRVVEFATSLGGVESTIERRAKHPGQEHVPAGLLRVSVGCEHVDDLWEDIDQAIAIALAARSS